MGEGEGAGRFPAGERAGLGRRPPAPLGWLLVAVATFGIAWAVIVPPWQAPDESSHFGYVQSLVDGPGIPDGSGDRPLFSSEQKAAAISSKADQTAGVPFARPEWSERPWNAWLRFDARLPSRLRSDGGGANPAGANPPLFYLLDSAAYAATGSGNIFARLIAMRVLDVLWLLLTVIAAWLLAGELFARDRQRQLVAAGVAGLLPMVTFISASVSPDGLLYALWGLVAWLGVRVLKRGLGARDAAALFLLAGLAIITKAASYALLPGIVFVLGLGLWRQRSSVAAEIARIAAVALVAIAIPTVGWFVTARALDRPSAAQIAQTSTPAGKTNVRQFASYVWQYYLPRLWFQQKFPTIAKTLPAYDIWITTGWAAFGWLEVQFPSKVYWLFLAITLAAAATAVATLLRDRRRVDRAVVAYFALLVVPLLGALHWTEYHLIIGGQVNFNQGRYLFPLVGLMGAMVAQALTVVRGSWRAVAAGGVLGGLVVLQLFSLGLVLTRYYA